MGVEELEIPGAWVFTPKHFGDDRGVFFEWFQDSTFREHAGDDLVLAQANCSVSQKGVLRGIHYANVPPGQRKYVTCFSGSALDVLVDLREGSPTFGKWCSVLLDADERKVVSIPNGVGHAFMALEDNTTVVYLVSTPFSPSDEFEINPLDEKIGINWGMNFSELKISEKDKIAPTLAERLAEGKLPK